MRFAYFTHALTSCWNHGNAHFQRGVLRALQSAGHTATAYEPAQSWSRDNLVRHQGREAADEFPSFFPGLHVCQYAAEADLPAAVQDVDVVIVHEWTDPAIVAALGRLRLATGRFTLIFHDTHHRAVSDPETMRAFDLSGYDAVLAFGATLARVYERWGWTGRVFVWHEAADTFLFQPPDTPVARRGVVWIGNWGDGERNAELQEFLLRPAHDAGLTLDIHGVRYPPEAQDVLASFGARYRGWIANALVPDVFSRHTATVHVPRRFYTAQLPGIPTIRVFEALACGIPLVCAPWQDSEDLFRPGEDYLVAQSGAEMSRHLRALAADPALAASIAKSGLARVRERHSCTTRVSELMNILRRIDHGAAAQRGAA